ncbi:MAG: ETC complex I subunit [Pseudomonadota bacterium]
MKETSQDKVVIYQPSKSSMQSGRGKSKIWCLEFRQKNRKAPDPLMGWIGGADTQTQMRLTFDSLDEAVAYAENKKYDYEVRQPKKRSLNIKSYSDNFSTSRKENWTH